MRWRKISSFVVALFSTIAYAILTFFFLLGTTPTPVAVPKQYSHNLIFSFVFLVIALIVTWWLYFQYRNKASARSFYLSIILPIIFILIGLFLWANYI